MNDMMKAVQLHSFGGPEVLLYEDTPRPEVQTGEVLIQVNAASLNPPDLYLRDGYRALPPEWQPSPHFPLILGTDVSGVVAAIGDEVSKVSVGDHVFAMVRFPEDLMTGSSTYAEYVSVPESHLALKPKGISHVEAAGAPMSLLTVWQFLVDPGNDLPNPFQAFRHVPVPLEGKTVLINGAGGGVGHLAVQVAKWKVSMKSFFASWVLMTSLITPRQPPKRSHMMWIWCLTLWVARTWSASSALLNQAVRSFWSTPWAFLPGMKPTG